MARGEIMAGLQIDLVVDSGSSVEGLSRTKSMPHIERAGVQVTPFAHPIDVG